MSVHTSLERFFFVCQLVGAANGVVLSAVAVVLDALDIFPRSATLGGLLLIGLAFGLFWPVAFSPPARRTIHAWLSRLSSAGEAQQASAVAGLLGDLHPAKALAIGRATFRGLPFSSLAAVDLASNADTGLNTRIVPLALGKADAFLSHSWHDDPDAKWAALEGWVGRFEAEHKRSPMLWLDKVCP